MADIRHADPDDAAVQFEPEQPRFVA